MSIWKWGREQYICLAQRTTWGGESRRPGVQKGEGWCEVSRNALRTDFICPCSLMALDVIAEGCTCVLVTVSCLRGQACISMSPDLGMCVPMYICLFTCVNSTWRAVALVWLSVGTWAPELGQRGWKTQTQRASLYLCPYRSLWNSHSSYILCPGS